MNLDRTLIILKPDALQRGLAGEIIARLERRGLKIVGLKLMRMDRPLAERHYESLRKKDFYDGLIEYITSRPVIVGVVEGPNAARTLRDTVGDTNPLDAAPGTVRFDFGVSIGRNLIHASDKPESAEREIGLFFQPDEIIAWERDTDHWIFRD